MKKRIIVILCSIVAVIAILGITIYLQNIYGLKEKYISPNKEYIVVIKGYGPKWSFGSENIKVIAYKNSISGYFNKVKYDTEIKNDGKSLNDSNYEIKWDENIAYLSLIGEEQEDENLVIEFGDKINISKIDNNKENTDSFKAKVLKNNSEKSILVQVINDCNSFKKGDKVLVHIPNYEYQNIVYEKEMILTISFNGLVEESNPPQISTNNISLDIDDYNK